MSIHRSTEQRPRSRRLPRRAWQLTARRLAFLAAICLVVSCAANMSGDAATTTATLMSFNIRTSSANDGDNSWTRRAPLVLEVIRSNRPDVLGVQEAETGQVAFLRAGLPGYAVVTRSREPEASTGEAVPIFFDAARWQLASKDSGTFWLSDTPDVPGSRSWGNNLPRIVTWVRLVNRETGKGLYVFNLHLDHESEVSRQKSAELVASAVRQRQHPDPVVVLGDFNAEPGSVVVATLRDGAPGLADSFVHSSSGADPKGTFHDFNGNRSGPRIDYILTSADLAVLEAEIVHTAADGFYPSDHFPVRARVEF
jgi:endonuclease/exonuclease/phosphatase family metal-dependent hydrolase